MPRVSGLTGAKWDENLNGSSFLQTPLEHSFPSNRPISFEITLMRKVNRNSSGIRLMQQERT